MKITEQDLKNISLLSKIKIDEETSDSLVKDLESILTMVNKMDELDTSKINPLTHPCLLYTSPSPRDSIASRMPCSA